MDLDNETLQSQRYAILIIIDAQVARNVHGDMVQEKRWWG